MKKRIKEVPLPKPRAWNVHVTVESRKLNIAIGKLRTLIKEVLNHLEQEIRIESVSEVNVLLIDDDVMRRMNFEFRGKDKPTDVLSFPQFEGREIRGERKVMPGSGNYLGDLVVSTETTLRQAQRFGVTKEEEMTRLVVHGLLHLCGYDHEGVPAADAARMRRRERALRSLVSL
jgi:probable rRNA maturation factor